MSTPFPPPSSWPGWTRRDQHIEGRGDELTVMADDRPGLFSRVAGVLALHGLDVLEAAAHSTDDGRALARFRVVDHVRPEVPWARGDRRPGPCPRRPPGPQRPGGRPGPDLRAPPAAVPRPLGRHRARSTTRRRPPPRSSTCTPPTRIGVLYRITRALAELDLDIRSARVQTLGPHVIDSFYVRDRRRREGDRQVALAEIERAILHSLDQPDAR